MPELQGSEALLTERVRELDGGVGTESSWCEKEGKRSNVFAEFLYSSRDGDSIVCAASATAGFCVTMLPFLSLHNRLPCAVRPTEQARMGWIDLRVFRMPQPSAPASWSFCLCRFTCRSTRC